MTRNIDAVFSRDNFFKLEAKRIAKNGRQIIRDEVLRFPNSSTDSLRSGVRSAMRVVPLENVRVARVVPAKERHELVATLAPDMQYRNLVELGFRGSPRLFAAIGSGHPLTFRSAVLTDTAASLVYFADHNRREDIEKWAADDMQHILFEVQRQRDRVDRHNARMERYADRAIEFFAEHIELWRKEGRLDWSRRRAG